MLALVDNQPKVLNLYEMLKYYLMHQEDVVTRRTKYDLNKAEERAHILEGLIIALDNIDRVISIIRGSENVQTARESLMKEFNGTVTGYRRYETPCPDRSGKKQDRSRTC